MANDREKVVGGDLRCALLGQEGAQVETLEGEGDMAVDLEGVRHLMPEALQVDAQDLWGQWVQSPQGYLGRKDRRALS